jgi:hypothetical protein
MQVCEVKNGIIINVALVADDFDLSLIPQFLPLPIGKWIGDVFNDITIETLAAENADLTAQLAQADDAALSLFEAQAATDEAILAIYEKIGGTTA